MWEVRHAALTKENNIALIKDREPHYLEEISRALRESGPPPATNSTQRFRDQKIPDLEGKSFPAISTKLGWATELSIFWCPHLNCSNFRS